MRRVGVLVLAALALGCSVALAEEPVSAPGVVWSPKGAVLTRVDAVSRLALPNEPTVLLGYARYGLATSPDGELLASTSGLDRNVHISDLDDLTRTWTIGPIAGAGASTFWIGRRTLVAAIASTISVLDVEAQTVLQEVPVEGVVVAEAARAGRYVALVAPGKGLGALHLISVGAAGRVRTIALPDAVHGGRAFTRAHVLRMALPGLALSSDGERAYVVPRGNRIIAASLGSGKARVISVHAGRTLQAAAKLPGGWWRTSALLGTGTLVSTGSDFSGREYVGLLGGAPAGLLLTDLRTHRTHVAMPGANQFRICGGRIVAARSTAEAGSAGVAALDRTGRPLWSQYAGAGAWLAGCTRAYVYLQLPGAGVATLDARTGAVLEAHRGSAATVIELR